MCVSYCGKSYAIFVVCNYSNNKSKTISCCNITLLPGRISFIQVSETINKETIMKRWPDDCNHGLHEQVTPDHKNIHDIV